MPGGDGSGPPAGRGSGSGRGAGRGQGGKGRMGGNQPGAGPSGECLCPKCGTRVPHQAGKPCYEIDCPKCKAKMIRG